MTTSMRSRIERNGFSFVESIAVMLTVVLIATVVIAGIKLKDGPPDPSPVLEFEPPEDPDPASPAVKATPSEDSSER